MTFLENFSRKNGNFWLIGAALILGLAGTAQAQDAVPKSVTPKSVVPKSQAAIKQSFAPVVKMAAAGLLGGLAVVTEYTAGMSSFTGFGLFLCGIVGLAVTGHATRGIGGAPGTGATNVHLEPGALGPTELIADIRHGLYVTEMIGQGVNPVTGDYSRGASGFVIENGEIARPVAEITIAGNLVDMYRTLVPANDLEHRRATNVPTLRIEGMTVAGA